MSIKFDTLLTDSSTHYLTHALYKNDSEQQKAEKKIVELFQKSPLVTDFDGTIKKLGKIKDSTSYSPFWVRAGIISTIVTAFFIRQYYHQQTNLLLGVSVTCTVVSAICFYLSSSAVNGRRVLKNSVNKLVQPLKTELLWMGMYKGECVFAAVEYYLRKTPNLPKNLSLEMVYSKADEFSEKFDHPEKQLDILLIGPAYNNTEKHQQIQKYLLYRRVYPQIQQCLKRLSEKLANFPSGQKPAIYTELDGLKKHLDFAMKGRKVASLKIDSFIWIAKEQGIDKIAPVVMPDG